jgi:hypothetical protein
MIPKEDLIRWVALYDLGHRNLDGWSDLRTEAGREELNRELKQAYARLVPGRNIPYGEFHRHAVRKIIAFLKGKPPSV